MFNNINTVDPNPLLPHFVPPNKVRSPTFSKLTLYFSKITSCVSITNVNSESFSDKFTNIALTILRKPESITPPSTVSKWLTKILNQGNIWPKNPAGIANLKSRGIV